MEGSSHVVQHSPSGASRLVIRHNMFIESFYGPLKAGKLHHSVRDLSSPERNKGLVEPIDTFFCQDFGEGCSQSCWEGSNCRCLDSDLAALHGRKSNIGKELSTGRGSEVERCFVQI